MARVSAVAGEKPSADRVQPDLEQLKSRPGLLSSLAFWPFYACLWCMVRIWFRLRVENRPRMKGAYVLVANHASFLDPALLGLALPRRVVFMMTEVHWRSPLLGWFYRWNRAIPLSARGGNRVPLRAARDVLRQGRLLGIFPEGGLSRDGELLLGSPGAVSLVLGESVPIVPVGIIGADRAMPVGAAFPLPRKVVVRFGEPIEPEELMQLMPDDRKKRLQAATEVIMQRIAALTDQVPREQQIG